MLNVAILGGSGYTGGELLRLLLHHPQVKVTAVTSERSAGKPVFELFPNLKGIYDSLTFEPLDIKYVIKKADLFCLCLPHKKSQEVVFTLHKAGKKVIDLSADYRLKDSIVYEEWYKTSHLYPDLLKKAVYGLSELYREKIKKAEVIANPGCYPVSAILGLAPIIKSHLIDFNSIIIDSKSGVSGAGRNPDLLFMFSEANESVKAYAITAHRHTPEIEQELSRLLGTKKKVKIVFTPHLVPMDRGILSTIYVNLRSSKQLTVDSSRLHKIYQKFYEKEPFVRVLKEGAYPNTKAVKGTNFCDISVFVDKRKNSLIIVSAIDNLLKGASGQAVQNMNIMYGFDETTGLKNISHYP
ncbi:MAG: N-acetyl-gamma-glutamyl-phosphate reductase [Nitrospirae bacterium]|nr:N-acetyl-gamma-glutamyl-phosphate reductase [Nitrospirota bacterium]